MMRDIPSLSFLCAGIHLVSSLHQSNYTWSPYKVRAYLQRQWKQILSGRVSLQDFVSAKEDKQTMLLLMGNSSSPSLAKIQRKL
ncbi:DNA polymerase zeta catalytic subunit isoform X2 [Prunus persica]|uniref:DNA polymerase zeta catalytic subunit n=1 Tax=Prunus persica TaxID=3760 RepID=UPI0009ABA27C|nr:DNA polymerase zeta catalytic subunit [Prunus persica]XP_020420826.1 DNA polymerase zeta catalytic subunit isoform X2 [Prunus persica]